ncbi:transporter substrate-binding domain-containing protein [Roseovarius sp. S4756]|uniref:transporter substrate-binding domain-containing protein n=1 Tax=Roseovarius maritimus TaxID=3342637 RepID=UPI0037262D36
MPRSQLRRLTACLILLATSILSPLAAASQETAAEDIEAPLIVATKTTPPFAYMGPGDEWTGIAIDVVDAVAADLGRTVVWREDTLEGMLDSVEAGTSDAAAAAITITPAREANLDFTFPFYTTGLGIAVDPEAGSGWMQVLRNFFTWQFAVAIATLSAVLLSAGAAVWAFERGHNEEFPKDAARGLGDGFWWAAVTMTTVGYGDKAPRSLGGRIVGLIWMFTSMLIVASFTAAIAASLTVGSLGNPIQSVTDLSDVRVGVIDGTTGADEMIARRVRIARYDDVAEAFDALLAGHVGAVVHDRPLLQWVALQEYESEVRVLEDAVGRQDYGIALQADSPLREPMNQALLEYLRGNRWADVQNRYLGNN